MNEKPKIEEITVKRELDNNPDLSYLGEFGNDECKFAIEHDIGNSRTYNYFNANNVENMIQARENYERIMEFERGEVGLIGIVAHATVSYPIDNNGDRRREYLSSSGLWGIETDNTSEEIESIEKEQLDDLREHLNVFGVDVLDFDKKIKK